MANIEVALRVNNTASNKNTNDSGTVNDDDCPIVDEKFEYRGYHKFGHILGRGSFGTVIECVRKCDQKAIALKLVKTKAIYKWVPSQVDDDQQQQQELIPIEVACLLRAANISGVIKLIEYWPSIDTTQLDSNEAITKNQQTRDRESGESKNNINVSNTSKDNSVIGIVLERNYNEECLFDYLIEKNSISENEAGLLIKQIVEINLDLLRSGILHGDLKSENMLIDRRTKKIKLIDFGSAEFLDSKCSCSKAVKTFRGTNLYKPPEYLLHHGFYPRPSTVWTIGIILYNMVTGDFPFQSEEEVLDHKTKDVKFACKESSSLSTNLKDLIKKCLAFYAADRIVIEKILTHPWLVSNSN